MEQRLMVLVAEEVLLLSPLKIKQKIISEIQKLSIRNIFITSVAGEHLIKIINILFMYAEIAPSIDVKQRFSNIIS